MLKSVLGLKPVIKRTIEISSQGMHLSCRHGQLVLQPFNADKSEARTVPCEDIGVVMIDHPAVSITHHAMAELSNAGAAVVVCGANHLPAGMMLPLSGHTQVGARAQTQISASAPAKKRIWQQLITAKIQRQANNLPFEHPAHRTLQRMASDVKTGDTTNLEAQAARLYWSVWLDPRQPAGQSSSLTAGQPVPLTTFRRDQDGLDPVNTMLNYGYAVLRAALGRAIVSAGLIPALGVHHHHRSNAFALADDLIEPFRPLVDSRVRHLHREGDGANGIDRIVKTSLLSLLVEPVNCDGTSGPLMVALHRLTASVVDALQTTGQRLALPSWHKAAS